MSRYIDPDRIASGELEQDEILYLQNRGQLPPHIRPLTQFVDDEGNLQVGPPQDVWDIIKEMPLDAVRDLYERRIALFEASTPTIANEGGIVGDGTQGAEKEYKVETYATEDGWSNDSRMAELVSRGLSVSGKKDVLIDRLLRSDAGELTPEDYPPGSAGVDSDEDVDVIGDDDEDDDEDDE